MEVAIILGLGKESVDRPFWHFGTAEDGLILDQGEPDMNHRVSLKVRLTGKVGTKEYHDIHEDAIKDVRPTKQNPKGLTIILCTPNGKSPVGEVLDKDFGKLVTSLQSARDSIDTAVAAKEETGKLQASSFKDQVTDHLKSTKVMRNVLSSGTRGEEEEKGGEFSE